MSTNPPPHLARLALSLLTSIVLHGALVGLVVLLFLSVRPPVVLMGGGGSSGTGGKRGEGGVASDRANQSGFALKRLASSPEVAAETQALAQPSVPHAAIDTAELLDAKVPVEPVAAAREQETIKRYIVDGPAPALVPIAVARAVVAADASAMSDPHASVPQNVARQRLAMATMVGSTSVTAQELRAAAGRGAGILGGANGSGAGNGGGGRPGVGRGGGIGTGQGRGIGNRPTLASGNQAPKYPSDAQRARQQGRVLLRVVVEKNGSAANVTLEESSGVYSLDDAALDAVKSWRFIPASQFGTPVAATVLVPIRFVMRN